MSSGRPRGKEKLRTCVNKESSKFSYTLHCPLKLVTIKCLHFFNLRPIKEEISICEVIRLSSLSHVMTSMVFHNTNMAYVGEIGLFFLSFSRINNILTPCWKMCCAGTRGCALKRLTRNYSILVSHRWIVKMEICRCCSCGCMEETSC